MKGHAMFEKLPEADQEGFLSHLRSEHADLDQCIGDSNCTCAQLKQFFGWWDQACKAPAVGPTKNVCEHMKEEPVLAKAETCPKDRAVFMAGVTKFGSLPEADQEGFLAHLRSEHADLDQCIGESNCNCAQLKQFFGWWDQACKAPAVGPTKNVCEHMKEKPVLAKAETCPKDRAIFMKGHAMFEKLPEADQEGFLSHLRSEH